MYLFRKFFSKTNRFFIHERTCLLFIFFLFFNKVINTIKSDTSIITNDATSTIGIGKSCNNCCFSSKFHFICIGIEYSLIVCFTILSKHIFYFFTYFIAISFTRLNCHSNSTKWLKGAFKWLVSLKSNNFLQFFI